MIVVDASVLIAYLDRADAHHAMAIDVLSHAVTPLVAHPITLAEVLVAPTRNGTADAAWNVLSAIGVEVHAQPIDPIVLASVRVRTGLRMPDCCVVAAARELRCTVATFDERLRRAVG